MAGQTPTSTSLNRRMWTAWPAMPTPLPMPRATTATRPRASTCWRRPRACAAPTRDNCGKCHFDGGGGNNVKHGDLDESLLFPSAELDVHMGEHNFLCTDCHTTEDHADQGQAAGRQLHHRPRKSRWPAPTATPPDLHDDERINCTRRQRRLPDLPHPGHGAQGPDQGLPGTGPPPARICPRITTPISRSRARSSTKRTYQPTYKWFNGNADYRYLLGDTIRPDAADADEPAGRQTSTTPTPRSSPSRCTSPTSPTTYGNNTLLQPVTAGEDGFWSEFDWDKAFELADAVHRPALQRRVRLYRDADVLADHAHGPAQGECAAVR